MTLSQSFEIYLDSFLYYKFPQNGQIRIEVEMLQLDRGKTQKDYRKQNGNEMYTPLSHSPHQHSKELYQPNVQ